MDNRVAGCQPPAGATPLLGFGMPSPPGVVGMVMAPGSASGKHPFYVVCKCGLGCCVCGGRRVGVGVWGLGLLVVLPVCALFVGGGGWVWVKCPCGGFGSHPRCWVFGWCWCSRRVVWLSATVVVVYYFALLFCSCVLLRAVVCWRVALCASAAPAPPPHTRPPAPPHPPPPPHTRRPPHTRSDSRSCSRSPCRT